MAESDLKSYIPKGEDLAAEFRCLSGQALNQACESINTTSPLIVWHVFGELFRFSRHLLHFRYKLIRLRQTSKTRDKNIFVDMPCLEHMFDQGKSAVWVFHNYSFPYAEPAIPVVITAKQCLQ
ncbi:hypothetical protein AWN76_006595 [Rhodothermaceae bacterium RA]|nr:hypothetical protein AWN76_006595 [Rhodothermaceae bacterium RA]